MRRKFKSVLGSVAFVTFALAAASRAFADYPIVAQRYLADPASMVSGGRVYIYCSNDDDNATAGGYTMHSLVCVSSSDMKNWTDHGVVFQVPANASWAVNSWAPAAIERNGKYYLYFANNASGIGVASSTSPTGPFVDAKGGYLINASTPGVLPATNMWIFDPAVFIDDDGHAYLYFGGNGESNIRVIKLNADMISTAGSAIGLTAPNFFEASWMHKRNGIYYFSYSTNTAGGLRIDYMTSTSPTSGFTYAGIVAGQPPINNNNNHAAIFEFNGAWYHVYHNRVVATQAGIPTTYRRNIAIESLNYDANGAILPVTYTTDGVAQIASLDPYARVEGETMASESGIETEPCDEGGMDVTGIDAGDWIRVRGVDFGRASATKFAARIASAGTGGNIELHLDSSGGTLVGSCAVGGTGGGQNWSTVTCSVSGAVGVHDLFLVFTGTGSSLFNLNWWQFEQPPVITNQPRAITLAAGGRLSLWVEAAGTMPLSYQWSKGGMPVAGATGKFFEVASAAAGDAGDYTVEISNSVGSAVSSSATVSIDSSASAHLVNMSVRAPLDSGATLIPGYVTRGTSSSQLLIRAVGPTLTGLGVANALGDPAFTLFDGSSPVIANDDWGLATNAVEIASAAGTLGAFALGTSSHDAALLIDLAPAPYTAHVSGMGGTSGIVLFELYQGAGGDSQLANISARADIGTGDNIMIPGFSLAGNGATTLLIRAVGPSLGQFGVTGPLADPKLTIYENDAPILTNDNWNEAPDVAALTAASNLVGAFALDAGSADAAALVVLMPGNYTALASGVGNTTGNVLVEVYQLP